MHPFSFIVISSTGFYTSLTGEVNVDPAFAETHPRTLEQAPGEEMMEAVTVTAGREKEGSLFDELD